MSVIVGISGKIGSGKNYLATQLQNELDALGYTHAELAFASPLKQEMSDIIKQMQMFINDHETPVNEDVILWSELVNMISTQNRFASLQANALCSILYDDVVNMPELTGLSRTVSVRAALQMLGTDIRRAQDENYWTKQFFAVVDSRPEDYIFSTDIRFLNELECITQHPSGVTLRVEVPESVLKARREGRDGVVYTDAQVNHPSETSLDGADFDVVVGATVDAPAILRQIQEVLEAKEDLQ